MVFDSFCPVWPAKKRGDLKGVRGDKIDTLANRFVVFDSLYPIITIGKSGVFGGVRGDKKNKLAISQVETRQM